MNRHIETLKQKEEMKNQLVNHIMDFMTGNEVSMEQLDGAVETIRKTYYTDAVIKREKAE